MNEKAARSIPGRAVAALRRYGFSTFVKKFIARLRGADYNEPEREGDLLDAGGRPVSGRPRHAQLRSSVTFSIRPAFPHVCRLEIITGNPKRSSETRLQLEVSAGGQVLASSVVPAPSNGSWTSFTFPAVPLPEDGQPLAFTLRGEGAGVLVWQEGAGGGVSEKDGGKVSCRIYARDLDRIYSEWMHLNEEQADSPKRSAPFHVLVVRQAEEGHSLEDLESQTGDVSWTLHRCAIRGTDWNAVLSAQSRRPDLVLFLEPGIRLAPDALTALAAAAQEQQSAGVFYADADRLDTATGRRTDPFFRPDFSPFYLLGENWLTGLAAVRPDSLGSISALNFRDLVLQATERTSEVVHLPRVLHHLETDLRPDSGPKEEAAVHAAIRRRNLRASLDEMGNIEFHLAQDAPRVSLIIPNHNAPETLQACVRSVLECTEYPNYEILVAENNSSDPAVFAYYEELQREDGVRVERLDEPFNFSRINNWAARRATGDLLLFLNNDTEVITRDWLTRLAALVTQPGVGAAGAKLLYPDGTVQHGGVAMRVLGIAGHMELGAPGNSEGYHGRMRTPSEVSAVTGACLLVPRPVFEEVGGFDERYRLAFNDIDLCLKIRETGRSVLLEPRAVLYHYESRTRGYEVTPEQQARFEREQADWVRTWGARYPSDPYYNRNLRYDSGNFETAPEKTGASAARVRARYDALAGIQ